MGIYPAHEVIQPTIVDKIAFLAWKDEAFHLAKEWGTCYPEGSEARELLFDLASNWCLINIVHNDFHAPSKIFEAFENISAF